MRCLILITLASLGLGVTVPTGANQGRDCDTPPSQEERERAKPPKKKRGLPNLTPDELREWGPIHIEAVINCKGMVVGVKILESVPAEVEAKIRHNLAGWRYRPGALEGEAIAVPFQLVLQHDPPRGWGSPHNNAAAADAIRRFAPGGAAGSAGPLDATSAKLKQRRQET